MEPNDFKKVEWAQPYPGARRDTAGQTDPQEIRQTDHETQITSSCEEEGRESHPLWI